jgi:hypothetical protein
MMRGGVFNDETSVVGRCESYHDPRCEAMNAAHSADGGQKLMVG